ncbi:MAG TPA: glycosyltransferase [Bryobacteraceae bacterium]|nr:glycosyltransferase [Bryobacteraceae bacterium]
MRLNWFSPLPPARTDIANYTLRTLPALATRFEVTLYTNQESWDPILHDYAQVRRVNSGEAYPIAELNRAEISLFHIGNDYRFHTWIYELSRVYPGVVVLHENCLHHFFAGLYHDLKKDRNAYLTAMQRHYNEEGVQAGLLFWQGMCSCDDLAARFPLTLHALENSVGCIVHSLRTYHYLTEQYKGALTYAPLPYDTATLPDPQPRSTQPPFHLVLFGYMGPNRRVESVLRALAEMPEKDQFQLHVFGQLWDRNYVVQMIDQLRLGSTVRLHGFLPEEMLRLRLNRAHMAFNLRYPTMGEASGTQLRIWAHAVAGLVTRQGWYSDLPGNCVLFVNPENEILDIQAQLRRLLNNPRDIADIGLRGFHYLQDHFSAESFAETVARMADTLEGARRQRAAIQLMGSAAMAANSWQTQHSNSMAQSIAGRVLDMLGEAAECES